MSSTNDCRDSKHETTPSPQEHVEEYLEVLSIAEELGDRSPRVSWIADRVGVAPPSVVQMLRKLSRNGFVTYKPRVGVTLLEKGRSVGKRIMRNHRIMETFVKKTVGTDLSEKVGCAIEHTMTEDFTNSICGWLNHPRECPHGYPIPKGACCP
jgi:DtxR family Mn-dependent transcriptional regulator